MLVEFSEFSERSSFTNDAYLHFNTKPDEILLLKTMMGIQQGFVVGLEDAYR